jgi:hypothetical protein
MHFCSICQKTFKSNQNLEKHIQGENHKKRVANADQMHECNCGKSFFHKSNLSRHARSCTAIAPENSSDIPPVVSVSKIEQLESTLASQEERLAQYEKEREEMRAQIALLLEAHASEGNTHTSSNQTNNIDNQNNIENQTNNNTINIHINAFGKENTDYLDDQAIVECIDRIFNSVPAILKRIHFDPDHPENHNIKITNKKLPYASVMGDNRTWKTVNKKDAIESMVAKGYNFLDEKYADTKNHLSKRRQQHFEGFQDKFADEDKEMHKQLMTNVELLVLNQGQE